MCGILFRLSHDNYNANDKIFQKDLWDLLINKNKQRGPDGISKFSKSIKLIEEKSIIDDDSRGKVNELLLDFFGAVLHLRGKELTEQPLISENHDILLWNGEIFDGFEIPKDENDTIHLFNSLKGIENDDESYKILNNSTKKLWFGRDYLGRRSLLWYKPKLLLNKKDDFILTSVGCKLPKNNHDDGDENHYFQEVPADGIYCLDFKKIIEANSSELFENYLIHYKWYDKDDNNNNKLPFGRVNDKLPNPDELPRIDNLPGLSIPDISIEMENVINKFIDELSYSVCKRVENIQVSTKESKISILFSGGLDCVCLAALTHKLTGRQSVEELRKIAPNRKWNFVEINIPYEESCKYKSEILELISPSDTIMDLSIAMAFWFAVRGKGQIINPDNPKMTMIDYESKAKVILVGIGADELLGGYSRHREAFKKCGWENLIKEIQLDVDRISTRNLGRDDRIISSHAKESRYPYLSANVVSYLNSIPIHLKLDLRFERGIGEKLLLRHVARRLGLIESSKLLKRAIQFGSKTARMTNETNKEKEERQ
ncbi:8770_t:CDS:10 [Entrophospora sp. SA101]|nr:8770_t:CDS:10 [Entrophospora sp. SA101]CAJ0920523.1 8103_t:CDS:10 [Entrophospora sp. SA101]